jgi:uncharacterized membrane protein
MRKIVRSQITFLLFGLVFWLPLAVLAFIISFLLGNAEEWGRKFLLLFLPQSLVYPGLGIVLGILLIYISGMILKLTKIGKIFSKIPFIGLLFGAGEIITIERLLNLQPCIFLLSPTCLSYGWILSDEKVKLGGEQAFFNLVNVYYPNVPTLVTGQVFPLRRETTIKLGNSSKEIIDLLLYAFRSPKDIKYLPWEGENLEDFAKRAKSFGLNLNSVDTKTA